MPITEFMRFPGARQAMRITGVVALLVVAAGAIIGISKREALADVRVEPKGISAPTNRLRITSVPTSPGVMSLVEKLQALGLSGADWHCLEPEGTWEAKLRKTVGGIEVSCLVQSRSGATVEHAEIELEIYARDYTERAEKLVDVYRAAIALIAPDLPDGMFDERVPWVHGNTRMERLSDTGSRNVLRFTLDEKVETR